MCADNKSPTVLGLDEGPGFFETPICRSPECSSFGHLGPFGVGFLLHDLRAGRTEREREGETDRGEREIEMEIERDREIWRDR